MLFESRIVFPDGRPCTCNGQYPDGWRPTTAERYAFCHKRNMLKHTTESGFTYEHRATALVPMEVLP